MSQLMSYDTCLYFSSSLKRLVQITVITPGKTAPLFCKLIECVFIRGVIITIEKIRTWFLIFLDFLAFFLIFLTKVYVSGQTVKYNSDSDSDLLRFIQILLYENAPHILVKHLPKINMLINFKDIIFLTQNFRGSQCFLIKSCS